MWSWSTFHAPLNSGIDNQELIDKDSTAGGESFRLRIWEFISALMGNFFALAAYVQHNDPDPLLWIPAYLLPALISWTNCFKIHLFLRSQSKSSKISNVETNLPNWSTLERLIAISKIYCLFLGLYTLSHYIYINHYKGGAEWTEFLKSWTSEISENEMMREEGKELLGLCLIIAWMSLIKDQNFIKFGRMGLAIGVVITLFPVITWILIQLIEGTYSSTNNPNTCH